MFTGIIRDCGTVVAVNEGAARRTFRIRTQLDLSAIPVGKAVKGDKIRYNPVFEANGDTHPDRYFRSSRHGIISPALVSGNHGRDISKIMTQKQKIPVPGKDAGGGPG